MDKKVEIIEATRTDELKSKPIDKKAKIRVCAYARVSTDHEEQQTSFENQVDEWTKRITSNPNYEFVKVYTDEGISGTSMKGRRGLKQMITDAKNGKFDLILCKSISRFSRNTAVCIQICKELKDYGVTVHFDKEGFDSSDEKNAFALTLFSSLAQQESLSISQNVNWAIQKKMREGQPMVNTKRFLGYDKNEAGDQLVINKDEAKIVKLIFDLYDSGNGCLKIANELTERGYKPVSGVKWHTSTILKMLKNEKYAGDLLQQKTYTYSYLGHIRKINNGEKQQYLVRDAHEAIISREQFDRVQKKLAINSIKNLGENTDKSKYNNKYPLSGLLVCLNCGHTYKRREWNSKINSKKHVFQCTNYVIPDENGQKCKSKAISECLTEQICCDIINKVYLSNSSIFSKVSSAIKSTLSTDKIIKEENQKRKLKEKISNDIDDLLEKRRLTDNMELKEKIDRDYKILSNRYEMVDAELTELRNQEIESLSSKDRLDKILAMLNTKQITKEMLNSELISEFFSNIFVVSDTELVFIIDGTHKYSHDNIVLNRKTIVNNKPIYESSITGLDPIKEITIKYKVILV